MKPINVKSGAYTKYNVASNSEKAKFKRGDYTLQFQIIVPPPPSVY